MTCDEMPCDFLEIKKTHFCQCRQLETPTSLLWFTYTSFSNIHIKEIYMCVESMFSFCLDAWSEEKNNFLWPGNGHQLASDYSGTGKGNLIKVCAV